MRTVYLLCPILPNSITSFPDLVKSAHCVSYLRALLKLIETEVTLVSIVSVDNTLVGTLVGCCLKARSRVKH